MKLTPGIAQSIVSRTMKLLRFNINIMNEKGIIIASGDPSRIDAYHQGAYSVLKNNRTVEIKKGNMEFYEGAKEGVNLPIRFNDLPVGVVGITGDPDAVRIHGAMVQAMAELMLEEAFYWEQEAMVEQAKFSLINDLVYDDSASNINVMKARANILGYNLDLPRVAVVFEAYIVNEKDNKELPVNSNIPVAKLQKMKKQVEEKLYISEQDLFAAGIGGRYILLKQIAESDPQIIKKDLETLFVNLKKSRYIISAGVGRPCNSVEHIPESFRQALQALEVGLRLYSSPKIIFTDELGLEKFVDLVGKEFRHNFCSSELLGLKTADGKYDQLLIETAKTYLESGLKSSDAARKLYIHRNTLFYRIEKIRKLTGLDLGSVDDALKFRLALMCLNYDDLLM